MGPFLSIDDEFVLVGIFRRLESHFSGSTPDAILVPWQKELIISPLIEVSSNADPISRMIVDPEFLLKDSRGIILGWSFDSV